MCAGNPSGGMPGKSTYAVGGAPYGKDSNDNPVYNVPGAPGYVAPSPTDAGNTTPSPTQPSTQPTNGGYPSFADSNGLWNKWAMPQFNYQNYGGPYASFAAQLQDAFSIPNRGAGDFVNNALPRYGFAQNGVPNYGNGMVWNNPRPPGGPPPGGPSAPGAPYPGPSGPKIGQPAAPTGLGSLSGDQSKMNSWLSSLDPTHQAWATNVLGAQATGGWQQSLRDSNPAAFNAYNNMLPGQQGSQRAGTGYGGANQATYKTDPTFFNQLQQYLDPARSKMMGYGALFGPQGG